MERITLNTLKLVAIALAREFNLSVHVEPGSVTYGNAWTCRIEEKEYRFANDYRFTIKGRTARELYDAMYNFKDGYRLGFAHGSHGTSNYVSA